MPAKASAKGKKGSKKGKEGDGPDISGQMRRVRLEIAKAISELQISPELEIDKLFVTKIHDALSTNSRKLVFTGERPGPIGVHALSIALKELAPLNVNIKTLCFWRTPVRDEGLRVMSELILPKPKNDTYKWPGFVNLELLDCQVNTVMTPLASLK